MLLTVYSAVLATVQKHSSVTEYSPSPFNVKKNYPNQKLLANSRSVVGQHTSGVFFRSSHGCFRTLY